MHQPNFFALIEIVMDRLFAFSTFLTFILGTIKAS